MLRSPRARLSGTALTLASALSLLLSGQARAQTVAWAEQFGTSSYDAAFDVAAYAGGSYVVGLTRGALPGLPNRGMGDAFVRKLDANGNAIWTRQFGTADNDYAEGDAVRDGYVYVTGYTYGALKNQTNQGDADAFVRRYSSEGRVLWTRQFGTSRGDAAFDVAVSGSGVYVAGETFGALDGATSAGGADIFVKKFKIDGSAVWTRQFGTANSDLPGGVAATDTSVYVAGEVGNVLPGQTGAGSRDAFVRGYTKGGSELWTRQFGTGMADGAYDVSVDANGVYVGGWTQGSFPGETGQSQDAFVRQYASDGTKGWTDQFGTKDDDTAYTVGVDAGGVHVAGSVFGKLTQSAKYWGALDVFVRTYGAAGGVLDTTQFGTGGDDIAYGIAPGSFVAGKTTGAFSGQISQGGTDAFSVGLA